MTKETTAPAPIYAGMGIHERLHAVMGRIAYVQKEQPKKGSGGGLGYTILNYNRLVAKVRPLFVEYGIMIYPVHSTRTQTGTRTEMDIILRFVCVDNPESFIDSPSSGYGVDSQDKGPGKARTYSIKSALRDVLLLESGDDPDQDQSDAANFSAVDPAIEAAARAVEAEAAKKAKAEVTERKRLYSVATQCASCSGLTKEAVNEWLKEQSGDAPFADIPLDIFERAILHFEDLIPEHPKGPAA